MEGAHFSEVCETLVVSAHGCAILTRVKFDTGVPLHLHSRDGREATARVVSCLPAGADDPRWKLGAKLDRPENFWGVKDCPKDWALPVVLMPPRLPQILKPKNALATREMASRVGPTLEVVPERPGPSEAQVQKLIEDAVRPLQADVRALKAKAAQREANPSRFEVSLSSIPPEVEKQIEARLRRDLGPKVLEEARQQSVQLLASAKETIDQRTTECHENFRRGLAEELKSVEKRAEDISAHISASAREHLSRGLDEFQQKLLEGGNSLKRLSEQLLEFLQQNLNAEHESRRGDLEQLRASITTESSRLREQVEYLDTRIAKLGEASHSLESGLEQRLSRMASDMVRETRSQFESAANEILEELTAHGDKALGKQLEEVSGSMKSVQSRIVDSVSESLRTQTANTLRDFERSTQELARQSAERWRLKLEGVLNALAKSLSGEFQPEAGGQP
jgi:hypothetical protein